MTHQNLILTEKAIKAHCKRLQKELKNLKQELQLTQVQNLLAKVFGFNNFHELKEILDKEREDKYSPINMVRNFKNNFKKSEIFIFIKPKNKMNQKFQVQLKDYILSSQLGWKEQKIKFSEIKINQDYLVVYLNPESEFSDLIDLKEWGIKLHEAVDLLTKKICNYLTENKILILIMWNMVIIFSKKIVPVCI